MYQNDELKRQIVELTAKIGNFQIGVAILVCALIVSVVACIVQSMWREEAEFTLRTLPFAELVDRPTLVIHYDAHDPKQRESAEETARVMTNELRQYVALPFPKLEK